MTNKAESAIYGIHNTVFYGPSDKFKQIKEMADAAIALQNKDQMDAALRDISGIAMSGSMLTMFEDKRVEELQRQLSDSAGAQAVGAAAPAKKGGAK